MSFNSEDNKVRYAGDGSTTQFSFTFPVTAEGDIVVWLIDNTDKDNPTDITSTSTIALTDDGDSGGTVTAASAPTDTGGDPDTGEDILIVRTLDLTQEDELPTEGNFPETQVENMIDYSRMIDIQLQEQIDRTFRFRETSEFTVTEVADPTAGDVVLGRNTANDDFEWKTADDLMSLAGALLIANNLSDLGDAAAALGNLSIDPFNVQSANIAIADSQSSAANLTGWTLDGSTNRAYLHLVSISRGSSFFLSLVMSIFGGTNWTTMELGATGGHGLTFSVGTGTTGQMKYVSDAQGAGNVVHKEVVITL